MSVFDEINQLSIFDVLEKTSKEKLEQDDKVIIRFYTDEIEVVRVKYLHLLSVGTLIKKKNDFWLVNFEGKYEWIEEKRLNIQN